MRGGNLIQWRRRYDNLGLRFHLDNSADERLVEGSAVLGEISAAAHRRNSPMIAANAAADNHKIAAQRHGNSVRRNITAACRQLVLVERRLRIRPQEVFLTDRIHPLTPARRRPAYTPKSDLSKQDRKQMIYRSAAGLAEETGPAALFDAGCPLGSLRSFVGAALAGQPASTTGRRLHAARLAVGANSFRICAWSDGGKQSTSAARNIGQLLRVATLGLWLWQCASTGWPRASRNVYFPGLPSRDGASLFPGPPSRSLILRTWLLVSGVAVPSRTSSRARSAWTWKRISPEDEQTATCGLYVILWEGWLRNVRPGESAPLRYALVGGALANRAVQNCTVYANSLKQIELIVKRVLSTVLPTVFGIAATPARAGAFLLPEFPAARASRGG